MQNIGNHSNTKYIINYPQYITWKFTNNFSSEIYYLGCHTHLWNFKKKGLPIKIHKKFDNWYQVETPDGSIGWMSGILISRKKTILVLKNEKIYKDKNEKSRTIANVDKNSILKIHYCKNEWCKVESERYRILGFIKNNSNNIWGAYVSNSK